MNDLAQKALDGLSVGYHAVRRHALLTLAVAGTLTGCVVVVAQARVGAAQATVPLTTWLGLQDTHLARPEDRLPGAIGLAGVAVLLLLWLTAVEVVRRRRTRERAVWGLAAAWVAPFALGPPLFDSGVYSYAAYGLLARAGDSPYGHSPTDLGYAPVVDAIDPATRDVAGSNGPLATLVQHAAASVTGGSALAIVIVLRIVSVAALIWLGRTAADLGARRPGRALSLTVTNPLLIMYGVSAVRLELLLAALALAAVAAANRRAWSKAVTLAAAATSLLGTGVVVLLAVLAVHLRGRSRPDRTRTALRDLGLAAVVLAAIATIVPDGFGWLGTVRDQFATHTTYAVADLTASLFRPIVGDAASYDALNASTRAAVTVALVATVVALLLTCGRRPLERTAGYALLAVALLAPALYPWYPIAGLVLIAPSSNAVRKVWVLGGSCAACLLMPTGFGTTTTTVLAAIGLLVVATATGLTFRHQYRSGHTAADQETADTALGLMAEPRLPWAARWRRYGLRFLERCRELLGERQPDRP